jgi:undecaprenyl diphosphate synthase
MDGNGRWAKQRLFPRIEGHRAGAKAVRMVVEESRRLGIRYLTLFSFSTENWLRPKDEVSALMRLFCQYVESERDLLLKHSIRLRAIGDRSRLPSDVRESLERVEAETMGGEEMQLLLALSYGGRDEITAAAKTLAARVQRNELTLEEITPEVFSSCLYAPDVPDPDLLIRTSDEFRISNFLLWQLAYSEIVVTKCFWPAFTKEEFQRCLDEYAGRRRRFGLTDEQIESRNE